MICIDTGGYTKYFVDDYAIILKLNNRGSLILAMEEAILKLKDKKISRIMGEKAKAAGQKYNWEMKGKEIYSLISKYI
jgi:glycosyltransferase involved in cell wall biosynthesis